MTDRCAGDRRTDRERMLAGDLHVAEDPEPAAALRRATRLAPIYVDYGQHRRDVMRSL